MKQLILINGKYGYWKPCFLVRGWGSLGPIYCPCSNQDTANELAKEYEVEEDARVLVTTARILIEVNKEEVLEKRYQRLLQKQASPAVYSGILYGWDGEIIEFLKGTEEEFNHFIQNNLVYGQKLVYKHDKELEKWEVDIPYLW